MARPSYVLPLAVDRPLVDPELVGYLGWISAQAELIVVDGSPPEVFAEHDRCWGRFGTHVVPDGQALVGKVANVMTGVRLAAHERIVIADDDVRFGPEIADLVVRLDHAEVVRPQNFFAPLPWHAVWDSGRSLVNRVRGGDWPGVLAVRRSALLAAGGYAGDVIFENYEMVKSIEAAGGRHVLAPDLFVRRLPPTTGRFLSQRTRQAYDELARPGRLVPFLAVVPAAGMLVATRRWRTLRRAAAAAIALAIGAAEIGRRRDGGRACFPARCSLAAPLWAAERSVCVWVALFARARGGVVYRGRRVRQAALRPAERRRRIGAGGVVAPSPSARTVGM
ncbi:MAG: glycosyltransferase [Acidimicrobiales bacterium]